MSDAERAILAIVTEVAETADIGLDDELFEAGVTSLAFLRILTRVNQRFDVELTGAELDQATVGRLAACVEERAADRARIVS